MRFTATVALGLALSLSACGEEKTELDPPQEAEIAGGEDFAETPADDADVSEETPDGNIPAAYLGVWDAVTGTCDPASDGRMEIEPRKITYYESVGMVSGTGTDGDDAVVDLVMEGEGETWTQSTRLSLVETADGQRLHVTDATKPKVEDEFPRKKCP